MRKAETESFKKRRIIIGVMVLLMTLCLNINVHALEPEESISDISDVVESESVEEETIEEVTEETLTDAVEPTPEITEDENTPVVAPSVTPEEMLEHLPESITFDITEFESLDEDRLERLTVKAEELKAKLESQGYNLENYNIEIMYGYYEDENLELAIDIHKAYIVITNSEGEFIAEKEIEVIYSKSTYNETDAEAVKDKIAPIWFHRYQWLDVESDADFSLPEEDIAELINDPSIKFTLVPTAIAWNEFSLYYSYYIYFFKNDVLYGIKEGSFTAYLGVLIPNEVKENTESYIDYALPIIKDAYPEYPDITLVGESLGDTSGNVITEYDNYYFVKNDGTINKFSADVDDTVAKVEFADDYFVLSFKAYSEGEYLGTVILRKPNAYLVDEDILVNADLDENATITTDEIDEDILKEMLEYLKEEGLEDIVASHEVTLTGDVNGDITITFALGNENNNMIAHILQRKADGSYIKYIETAKEGKVTITVSELSSFVIAVKEPERILDNQPNTGIETKEGSSILIELIILVVSTLSLYKLKREV